MVHLVWVHICAKTISFLADFTTRVIFAILRLKIILTWIANIPKCSTCGLCISRRSSSIYPVCYFAFSSHMLSTVTTSVSSIILLSVNGDRAFRVTANPTATSTGDRERICRFLSGVISNFYNYFSSQNYCMKSWWVMLKVFLRGWERCLWGLIPGDVHYYGQIICFGSRKQKTA